MAIEGATAAQPASCAVDSNADLWWTPLGVRLTRARMSPGPWNWLFVPGHPGLGSACLAELVEAAHVPGTSWLVDLPGNGSNIAAPGAPSDPYRLWPDVIAEAVGAVSNPVAVGHAIGGQYLLSVPSLRDRLSGLVLIATAPDNGWLSTFDAMRAAHSLAQATEARERYEYLPTDDNLRDLTLANAPWHFSDAGLEEGRALLARPPHNCAAAEWSRHNFDRSFVATWWPDHTPALIISGDEDAVIDQSLWQDPYYQGRQVTHCVVDRAGHHPWVERPDAIRVAFDDFVCSLPIPLSSSAAGPS